MVDFLSDSFAGKRVVVIGCAQGHGFSIADGCARHGAELLLIDHNPTIADAAARLTANGHKNSFRTADVTVPATITDAFKQLAGEGSIDGLIYVPRARVRKPWLTITRDDWQSDLNTALSGTFFCVQSAFPYLCRSTSGPFVITLSSILSDFAGNQSAGYHSAKGGLESLTRYLAVELGPQKIRVNAVQVGWILKEYDLNHFNSEYNQQFRDLAITSHPLRRIGYSEDVLNSILFLGSDKAAFITGQILRLDGGLTLQEQSHFLNRMMTLIQPP